MKTFITSDLHFQHAGILKFCPKTRPFNSLDEMHSSMIAEWNSKVSPEDLTWILGDVSFGDCYSILNQLNGKMNLVKGNHDKALLRSPSARRFENVFDYKELEYKKTKLVLFHFPILEWNHCHYGSVHFHGHTHGDPTGLELYRALDVGMDATGSVVSPIEEMIAKAKLGLVKKRH